MIKNLSELIEYAFNDISNQLKTFEFQYLHDDVERSALEILLCLNLKDFKRTIDNYAIVHTHNKHGQENKEKSRGQIAVIKEDYLLIPDIVNNPDSISVGEKSNIGTELIIYEKEINNIYYFYVEEVRKKRKSLSMKTLYKKKPLPSRGLTIKQAPCSSEEGHAYVQNVLFRYYKYS
jgi:phage-Barnase-EndoU-ColicinE5/D-RelE like nuclease3